MKVFVAVVLSLTLWSSTLAAQSYEDDSDFEPAPSRSENAIWALGIDDAANAKEPRRDFVFPTHTDETDFAYGIDVSHHNGSIDWNEIQGKSIAFVVIKATEGVGFVDKRFKENWRKLREINAENVKAGKPTIPVGAYHFFTPSDPKMQAQDFISAVGELGSGDLAPVLDLEWTSHSKDRWRKYSGEEIEKRAMTWLEIVERHYGIKPIIYTNRAWWEERGILGSNLGNYGLWIANYSRTAYDTNNPRLPRGFSNWTLWQFTDRGSIATGAGAISPFDANLFNTNEEDMSQILLK